MTDQDWEVDGAGGGSAGADSGAGAARPDRDGAGGTPANIVPFPGNWFGSVDELVPMRLEPRPSVVETAPPDVEPAAASAADASDFWEGDADALEEVSTAEPQQSSIALLRSPGAAKRRDRAARATATASSGASGDRDGAARPSTQRTVWARALAIVALVSSVGGVLLATHALPGVLGSGIAHRPTQPAHRGTVGRRHTPRVVVPTVTTSVTVTTILRARKHRHPVATAGGRTRTGSKGRTGSTGKQPSQTTAASTSAAATGSATQTGSTEATSHTSEPPAASTHNSAAVSNHDSTASGTTGTGCTAQSPDSGCRP